VREENFACWIETRRSDEMDAKSSAVAFANAPSVAPSSQPLNIFAANDAVWGTAPTLQTTSSNWAGQQQPSNTSSHAAPSLMTMATPFAANPMHPPASTHPHAQRYQTGANMSAMPYYGCAAPHAASGPSMYVMNSYPTLPMAGGGNAPLQYVVYYPTAAPFTTPLGPSPASHSAAAWAAIPPLGPPPQHGGTFATARHSTRTARAPSAATNKDYTPALHGRSVPDPRGGSRDSSRPKATSVTGAKSSLTAPCVEPLKNMVSELCVGLECRPLMVPADAVNPIPGEKLDALLQLTYDSFATDRDMMAFVKQHFPLELCLQLRDFLVAQHDAVTQDNTAELLPTADSMLLRDLVERRGIVTVSLIEVLGIVPSACSFAAPGTFDNKAELTSFCPLMRPVMLGFDYISRQPRGCIALLRIFSATAAAPRPADNMVRNVAAHVGRLIFDPQGNYLVSHVICHAVPLPTEEAAKARAFMPTHQSALPARTPIILALTGAKTTAQSASEPVAGVMLATPTAKVDLQGYTVFVQSLVAAVASDVNRALCSREATHVIENALKHVPFDLVPEGIKLLQVLVNVLDPLNGAWVTPSGRHCLQAIADAITKRAAMFPAAIMQRANERMHDVKAGVRVRSTSQ
jgi:hypothetical protein